MSKLREKEKLKRARDFPRIITIQACAEQSTEQGHVKL